MWVSGLFRDAPSGKLMSSLCMFEIGISWLVIAHIKMVMFSFLLPSTIRAKIGEGFYLIGCVGL